ncbi:MAG: class I SAM-dependent methyltransferase [Pseudomonadota bacterium]
MIEKWFLDSEKMKNRKIENCILCNAQLPDKPRSAASGVTVEVGGREFVQLDYQIVECDSCNLLNKTNILTEEDLSEYYNNVDFEKWATDDLYPTDRILVNQLERLPPGAKILDFGCSSGRLLSRFSGVFECYGVEESERASEIARQRGITMLDFADLRTGGFRFDVILMVDVFEHLVQPLAVLSDLRSAMGPSAQLIIATGNGDFASCRKDPANFWYFRNVEHVSMLTSKAAKCLAEGLNLTLVSMTECSHSNAGWLQTAFEATREWLFFSFRSASPLVRRVWSYIPLLKRVASWREQPIRLTGKDHVIAVYCSDS